MSDAYIVLEAKILPSLEAEVNAKIDIGYEPIGGIFYLKDIYSCDKFFQAVYKRPVTPSPLLGNV